MQTCASNSQNWQRVAGRGAGAAPYFRVFNPVLQGRKFDPEGAYVRRWVPAYPPSQAYSCVLAGAGECPGRRARLGDNLPVASRQDALAVFATLRTRDADRMPPD